MKTYKEVNGWFAFEFYYHWLLNNYLKNNMSVVEVGVYQGKSSICLADNIKNKNLDIKFYAVDHWVKDEEYLVFLKNMKDCGVEKYIIPIRMKSVEAAKLFEDNSLDFVFVDGDHSYESVMSDLTAWFPKVKTNGIIAGDDYILEGFGVIRAVNEFFHGKLLYIQHPIWMYVKTP